VNGPEAIKYPRSMVLMPTGDVVVCDTWSHRVLCYSPGVAVPEVLAGKPNSAACTPEQMCFPSGIAFDAEGRLYVTDTNNHRVQCFLPGQTHGTTVAGSADGVAGAGLNELNMPTGLCIDSRDGSLLVADRMNGRVLRFPAEGGQQGEVVAGPKQQLARPWGVCQDATGAIYVSDERRCMVVKVEAPKPTASSPPSRLLPPQSAAFLAARADAAKQVPVPKEVDAPKQVPTPEEADAPKQVPMPTEADVAKQDPPPCSCDHNALD